MRFSSKTGEGLSELLGRLAGFADAGSQCELTDARHMHLVRQAAACLRKAEEAVAMSVSVEMVAVDLKEALQYLGQITGEQIDEAVLNDIFSRFCVGK